MKTKFIIVLSILLNAACLLSQTDSIIYTKNIICLVSKKNPEKMEKQNKLDFDNNYIEISNVKSLRFLNEDSLLLGKQKNKTYGLNINNLAEVSKKSGTQGLIGFSLGFLTGGLLGLALTPSSGGSAKYAPVDVDKFFASFVGGLVLGVVGAIVGSEIDDFETLNVDGIPEKYKKSEIIKFLRENK